MPGSSWSWKFQIQISCQVSRCNTRWLQHFRYSIFWTASMCTYTYTYSYTYIHNFYLGKKKVKKVTFWMKSAAFTSKPQGLWRKECYNITDPSRQPFPPLASTNSYPDVRVPPSHRREQSFLLSLCLCNGFPTLCLLFSVPLLWDLAKIIFWSSDIPVSWSLLTRLLFVPFNLPFLIQFLQPYRPYLFQS